MRALLGGRLFSGPALLCSGYTVSEDGLTWTFTLREGITFSDGTPLTGTVAAQALRDAMAPDSHYAQRLGGRAIGGRRRGDGDRHSFPPPTGRCRFCWTSPLLWGPGRARLAPAPICSPTAVEASASPPAPTGGRAPAPSRSRRSAWLRSPNRTSWSPPSIPERSA